MKYEVKQGESIESIAVDVGHVTATIWEDGNNESLRNQRQSPHVLYPDDEVFIPAIRPATVDIEKENVSTIGVGATNHGHGGMFCVFGVTCSNHPQKSVGVINERMEPDAFIRSNV